VAITRDEEIKQLEAQADTLQRRLWMLEQQQRPFIHQLLNALPVSNSPLLIIFTMRADFLHRAAEHPELAKAIGEHDLIVSPMTADELRRAIERPAEAAGAGFEHGLVDELIKQTVDRPGALPLLEYALLELWKTKRADGLLTWAAFHELGGVEGALAARADAIAGASWSKDETRVLTWSGDNSAWVWVVEPRLLAAELANRVCHVFSDAEIGRMIRGWRGCSTELASVDADLKRYNALLHGR